MEFFETSEKVVVYMNKKRLELLITFKIQSVFYILIK